MLGFFSFGKFLMYHDLDESNWPEGARPSDQAIVRALLTDGFHEAAATIGDDDDLDSRLAPGEPRHIVDADSSQTLAIVDVIQGRNLVIQGPPGTGKSQTITNLIASALEARQDRPVRGREDGRAGGGQAPARRGRPGRGLPGVAQSQDAEERRPR